MSRRLDSTRWMETKWAVLRMASVSWHDLIIPPPEWLKPSRCSRRQRAGVRYQKRVEKWIAREAKQQKWIAHSGVWLLDPATGHPCQPDILIEDQDRCLLCLIEVKYTQTCCKEQWVKYRRALRMPALPCIQVCRRLTSPSTMSRLVDFHHGGLMLVYL
jgi:hypothetical protein